MSTTIIIIVSAILLILFILIIIVQGGKKLKLKFEENKAKLNELFNKKTINEVNFKLLNDYLSKPNFNQIKFERYLNEAIEIQKNIDGLISKYGEENAMKLVRNEYWIGMTKEQLIDAKGKPTKIEVEILKTKTKEIYIYGNKSSGDVFVFENEIMTKIIDR